MTYTIILNAVQGFQKLVRQDLPLRTGYKLSKMVRRVNEELDFFRQKEAELRAAHDGNIPQSEYDELLNFEIDWNEDRIDIPLDSSIQLSCADVDALEPFINFTE